MSGPLCFLAQRLLARAQLDAAVLSATLLGRGRRPRLARADAAHLERRRGHAARDQRVGDKPRPRFGELLVEASRTGVIAVSDDADARVRMRLDALGSAVE